MIDQPLPRSLPRPAGLLARLAALLPGRGRTAAPTDAAAAGGSLPAGEGLGAHLFDASPVPILHLDAADRVIACNAAGSQLFGTEPQLIGLPFVELVAPEERGAVAAALADRTPQAPPIEATLATARSTLARIYVGRIGTGASSSVLHLIDITQFKELENQIVQARKMQAVGQLAGGIAHDFNNLLTAMIGFCDLLLLRHRAGDQSFADIMQIKQNANRAASLVRQLLAFSRQQTLRPKVLDITDTLAELSHLLRRLIGPTVNLTLEHGRDLGLVRVDQSQFEQVIVNLAVNARDAMPEGGSLTIRTANAQLREPVEVSHETMPAGDYVSVELIDTGVGIPKDVMARIFEPFFTTKPVGMGTGLGLSTVYGIVRQTGGFVQVESEPGRGTAFRVYLPRHSGSAARDERGDEPADEARARESDLTGTGTILLVEDEDPVRLFSARALRNKGYKVLEAKSGEAALELLDGLSERIDVLLTDAVMPVIDGPTLIQLVRERRPDVKVICISGHTDERLRQRIDTAGNVSFLPKPFSLKQLATRVKEITRGDPPSSPTL